MFEMQLFPEFCSAGTFLFFFWRQYVSLFASIVAIVSLLLTFDRKSSRRSCLNLWYDEAGEKQRKIKGLMEVARGIPIDMPKTPRERERERERDMNKTGKNLN